MSGIFNPDNAFLSFVNKALDLLVLNVIWLILCLPLVTAVPATAALYYAVVKVIRRGRSYAVREFFYSFKQNFWQGMIFSGIACILLYVLYIDYYYVNEIAEQTVGNSIVSGIIIMVSIWLLATYMYICPVLSRFRMGIWGLLKTSFGMALVHLPTTFALIALAVVVLIGCAVILPGMCLFPSIGTLLSSFLLEQVLKKHLPVNELSESETTQKKDEWYKE